MSKKSKKFQRENQTLSKNIIFEKNLNPANHDLILTLILAILCLLVYGWTTHPAIPGGDSSELILVAHTWGVAHPPGYPLFTLIAHLFSLFPFGSIAYRVNLSSAFFGSGAIVLLFLALVRRTQSRWSAFLASGLFAFSPLIWRYATVAEVFALNHFFIAGLLYLTVRFYERPHLKWIYFSAFWVGLGLSNHHTLIFYGLPVLVWMSWICRKETLRFKALLKIKFLFLLGLTPYLYLPWSSSQLPLVSWGDQSHFFGFLIHLLRMEYGTFKLKVQDGGGDWIFLTHIFHWFGMLFREWLGIGAMICGIGIRQQMIRENRNSLNLIWVGSTFFYIFIFSFLAGGNFKDELSWSIQARFYQQSFLILSLGTAFGFDWFIQKVSRFQESLVPFLGGLIISVQMMSHYSSQSHPDAQNLRKFGIEVLKNLPVQAILITQGDQYAPTLRYLQMVENYRPDIKVLDQNMLVFGWSKKWVERNFPDLILPLNGIYSPFPNQPIYSPQGFTIKNLIDANLPQHPVFDLNGFRDNETSYEASYEAWPWGLSWAILPRGVRPNLKDWMEANELLLKEPVSRAHLDQSLKDIYELNIKSYGTRVMQMGVQEKNSEQIRQGISILEKIAESDELQDANFYHNLGIGYFYLMPTDSKASLGLVKAWKKYLSLNPTESAETESIRSTLRKVE